MVEFSDKDGVQLWLENKPRDFAIIIAVRAVLRVFPFLATALDSDSRESAWGVLLPVCYSNSLSLSYAVAPASVVVNAASEADHAISRARALVDVNSNKVHDSFYVVYTAIDIISAIIACENDEYSSPMRNSLSAIDSAFCVLIFAPEYSMSSNFWNALSSDAKFLDAGGTSNELFDRSLWFSNEEPEWSDEHWQKLKTYFAQHPDEHWHVWTDWWEDRRDGKPYNIEMEREIVLIPDEDWQQGPAHVNAMIADIRARYAAQDTDEEIPADNPVAPRFETAENRIVLRADMPDTAPDDEQTALYDALREQAVELRGLCPENSNRYAAQGKAVARFLTALGDDYESMHLSLLWIAGQKMRRFARADDARRTAADPEDDPMEPDQGALFGEVVTTYNVFSTGEPGLKAKDERAVDVATLSPDITAEAREFRRAVAHSPASFGEEVEPLLGEVLEEADDPIPGVEARGVVITRETFENLLGALARKARTEPTPEPSEISKGAKAAIGAGAVGSSAVVASAFIAAFETTLIAFATKLPTSPVWIGIIKSIAAKWDKFI